MADFNINDASTSSKHDSPEQVPGKPCPICGKVVPVNPSAGDPVWTNDNNRMKNS
jgi:hypothetical protein